jgi:hypothetical protein
MIAAAAVITRPVKVSPWATAVVLEPVRRHCSWTREIKNTS